MTRTVETLTDKRNICTVLFWCRNYKDGTKEYFGQKILLILDFDVGTLEIPSKLDCAGHYYTVERLLDHCGDTSYKENKEIEKIKEGIPLDSLGYLVLEAVLDDKNNWPKDYIIHSNVVFGTFKYPKYSHRDLEALPGTVPHDNALNTSQPRDDKELEHTELPVNDEA